MDEAVAGHADRIEMELGPDGSLTVRDNGRGIPIDPHPKFKNQSALEVILTTLHSGGKFSEKVYQTSGGLHGVGLSVVNALAEYLTVEVARDRGLWRQTFTRGKPKGKLAKVKAIQKPTRYFQLPSDRTRKSSDRRRALPHRAYTGWHAPRPISSVAWKSAGHATPSWSRAPMLRPKIVFIFLAGCWIFLA